MSKVLLPHLAATIQYHLNEISDLFKNPRITLLVRSPDLENADLLMTSDDPDMAIQAIKTLSEKESDEVDKNAG